MSERGRTVVVTATLLGVGVAGTSTATGGAALSHPRTATGTTVAAVPAAAIPAGPTTPRPTTPGPTTAGTTTPEATTPEATTAGTTAAGAATADPEYAAADPEYRPKHAVTAVAAAVPASRAPRPAAVGTTTPQPPVPAQPYAPARQRTRPAPVAQWVHPLPEARVTSCFGQRWGRLHAGVDLAAPNGTRVRAAGAGTVVAAGEEAGYGNAVLIDHGNGYLTHYGHLAVVSVRAGDKVAAGAQIGNEGSTGHSTGPHLHFEVHEGSYKNPIEPTAWMHAHGVDIAGCVPLTDG